MFMIDRSYFFKLISNYKSKIKIIETSIKIRDIKTFVIVFSEYIKLNIKILNLLDEKAITARILEIFHIMKDLSIKGFIEMNILESKCIKIDFKRMIIESCQNMLIDFSSTNFIDPKIKPVVTSIKKIIVFSHINQLIFAIIREKFKDFSNRDYVFYSIRDNWLNSNDDILSHIVNVNFSCIHVRNITDNSVFIFRRSRLETL